MNIPDWFWVLLGVAIFLAIATAIFYPLLKAGIRIVYQYEAGVVYTLGRFTGIKAAGIRFLVPAFQRMDKVDLRTKTVEIPRQEVITRDNITLVVEGVVYYRIADPGTAAVKVLDVNANTQSKAQAVIRDVVGSKNLDEVLQGRSELQKYIRDTVEAVTKQWGVEVEDILLQQLELPTEMRRGMAAEAEAERMRRAAVITSRGEVQSAANLLKAAAILSSQPGAFYLKMLSTMQSMSADPAQKIVMVMPPDVGSFDKFIGLTALSLSDVKENMAKAEASIKDVEKAFGEDMDGDGKVG